MNKIPVIVDSAHYPIVTFTGVDAHTELDRLNKIIRKKRPFLVEFGILLSYKRAGGMDSFRYPSFEHIEYMLNVIEKDHAAIHICGKEAVTDFLEGKGFAWDMACKAGIAQLNFRHKDYSIDKIFEGFDRAKNKGISLITQYNDANKDLWKYGLGDQILVDFSGGRGKLVDVNKMLVDSPVGAPEVSVGIAGGINLENAAEVYLKLWNYIQDKACTKTWIDMETSLRTGDCFNLDIVEKIAESIENIFEKQV